MVDANEFNEVDITFLFRTHQQNNGKSFIIYLNVLSIFRT